MYNVSSEYLTAISQPVRTFKIEAQFSYQNATSAVFDDDSITGEVKIESQAVSGSATCGIIDIGAVPSATASLTIIDDDAVLKKYTNSSFTIRVSLLLGNGEYEDVPMGTFFCDPAKTSRIGNRISVYAYDAMITYKFSLTDSLRSSLANKTAQEAVSILTEFAKCGFNQDLSGFPNSDLRLDFNNTQVVTGWDGIMWIAQLMGCFARINRANKLEFIQIKSTWEWFNEDHTLGTIIAARNISGAERYKTIFSDDRIHIIGVSMADENNKLITRSGGSLTTDSNVIIALEKNPLIKSTYALEDILDNILTPIQTTYFYAFRSEIINDPALDVGDTVRLQGGIINGTNQNSDLIGFITHNTWRYRGRQEIVNTGQTTDVAVSMASADGSSTFYAQPKTQTEKVVDSLRGGGSQSDSIIAADKTNGVWAVKIVYDTITGKPRLQLLKDNVVQSSVDIEYLMQLAGGVSGQSDRITASDGKQWVAYPWNTNDGGKLVLLSAPDEEGTQKGLGYIQVENKKSSFSTENETRTNHAVRLTGDNPSNGLHGSNIWTTNKSGYVNMGYRGNSTNQSLSISADSDGTFGISAVVPYKKAPNGLELASWLSLGMMFDMNGTLTFIANAQDMMGKTYLDKRYTLKLS